MPLCATFVGDDGEITIVLGTSLGGRRSHGSAVCVGCVKQGPPPWRTRYLSLISLKKFLMGFFSLAHSFCFVVPYICFLGLARRCVGLFQIRWACSTIGTMFRTEWAYKLVKKIVSFRCGTILYEEPNVSFVRSFRCSADLFPYAWFYSFTDFCPFPLFFCSA
jgi:hypothetical protein